MDITSFIEQMCIVTVLYHKKWEESETVLSVEKIARQLNIPIDLYVFDNSPEVNVSKPSGDHVRCEYYQNEQNSGVSDAYNKAAEIAIHKGKKWLLITDSDFTFDLGLLSAYLEAYNKFPDQNLFSPILICGGKIISPYKKLLHRYQILKNVRPGEYNSKNYFVINNGILCTLDAFQKIGGYCPLVKLDFSDDYFLYRYAQHFNQFVVVDYRTDHKMSSFEKCDLLTASNRFRMYSEGAKKMSILYKDGYWFILWNILRALRLSVRYSNTSFLKILFCMYKSK